MRPRDHDGSLEEGKLWHAPGLSANGMSGRLGGEAFGRRPAPLPLGGRDDQAPRATNASHDDAPEDQGDEVHVEVREDRRRHEDQRQCQQDGDDETCEHVEPGPVHPGPEDLLVVAEQQQEDRRAREQHPSQGLDRGRDQPEGGVRDEDDAGGEEDLGGEQDVELLRVSEAAVQRVAQAEHVAEGV